MVKRQIGVTTPPTGQWVQTDRAAHEAWAQLAVASPRAASVMHVIVANMGRHNALVASRATLAIRPTSTAWCQVLCPQPWRTKGGPVYS